MSFKRRSSLAFLNAMCTVAKGLDLVPTLASFPLIDTQISAAFTAKTELIIKKIVKNILVVFKRILLLLYRIKINEDIILLFK
jgi:hypothetical protein